MLTELEKQIIASIQGDMEITERPYQKIADDIGVSQSRLLDTLQSLCDRGVIRRFGATLRHQKSGYNANAMVAWQVPEERVADVGQTMAGFDQVSHCYRRDPSGDWPYNLYTMVHATSEAACREITRDMAQKAGIDRYNLLFSRQELKKTSMTYFPSDEDD